MCKRDGVIKGPAQFRYNCWFYWSKDIFRIFKLDNGGQELRPNITPLEESGDGVQEGV